MTVVEQLQGTLKGLGLTSVEMRLENLLEQAAKKEPSYADFLLDLLKSELEARRTRYLREQIPGLTMAAVQVGRVIRGRNYIRPVFPTGQRAP